MTAALGIASAAAQTEKPVPPKPDPILPQRIDRLQETLRDKKHRFDEEAVRRLQELGTALEKPLHKDDRKKVIRALRDALQRGKLRPPELSGIYIAAADALGNAGADGVKLLMQTYKSRRFPTDPEWTPVRIAMLKALGDTKHPNAIEFLTDRASRDREDRVMAAAGTALAQFAEIDLRVRKRIVKVLVAKLAGLEATATVPMSTDPSHPQYFAAQDANRTLRVIRNDWNETLSKLTGQRLTRGIEWQHWWNKNKTANWDA